MLCVHRRSVQLRHVQRVARRRERRGEPCLLQAHQLSHDERMRGRRHVQGQPHHRAHGRVDLGDARSDWRSAQRRRRHRGHLVHGGTVGGGRTARLRSRARSPLPTGRGGGWAKRARLHRQRCTQIRRNGREARRRHRRCDRGAGRARGRFGWQPRAWRGPLGCGCATWPSSPVLLLEVSRRVLRRRPASSHGRLLEGLEQSVLGHRPRGVRGRALPEERLRAAMAELARNGLRCLPPVCDHAEVGVGLHQSGDHRLRGRRVAPARAQVERRAAVFVLPVHIRALADEQQGQLGLTQRDRQEERADGAHVRRAGLDAGAALEEERHRAEVRVAAQNREVERLPPTAWAAHLDVDQ
mmetsp:Transcript_4762/g.12253  ORF Transcript_4762/g.12253 Transcript_4762/m.12253 type:complete len:355 (-) Transcript_4762:693-1757(-)